MSEATKEGTKEGRAANFTSILSCSFIPCPCCCYSGSLSQTLAVGVQQAATCGGRAPSGEKAKKERVRCVTNHQSTVANTHQRAVTYHQFSRLVRVLHPPLSLFSLSLFRHCHSLARNYFKRLPTDVWVRFFPRYPFRHRHPLTLFAPLAFSRFSAGYVCQAPPNKQKQVWRAFSRYG